MPVIRSASYSTEDSSSAWRAATPAADGCFRRSPSSLPSLILGWNVLILTVFVFVFSVERGSQSPRQPYMATSWWRHWAKLGVCCWLSLDCCINLSALQCSTSSLPLLFFLASPSLPPSSLPHSHTSVLERGSETSLRVGGWVGRYKMKSKSLDCLHVLMIDIRRARLKIQKAQWGGGRAAAVGGGGVWGSSQNFEMWQKRKWVRGKEGGCSNWSGHLHSVWGQLHTSFTYNPTLSKMVSYPPPPTLTQALINMPNLPISAPLSRGHWVRELMIVISYSSWLFTIWWTTNKSITVQMDCIIMGLQSILCLWEGDVNTGLLTNSIRPLHLKGCLSQPRYHSATQLHFTGCYVIHIQHHKSKITVTKWWPLVKVDTMKQT